jgi:predicted RNA-binding Zn ribbon-like protein
MSEEVPTFADKVRNLGAMRLNTYELMAYRALRIARGDAIASLLGPVAEAVAQLLAEGNFALVKQCEHPDCILWFYDRTKSHKRRWCSMAQCGNRYKAAQFRKRSSGEIT